jgi:hypothetical protein
MPMASKVIRVVVRNQRGFNDPGAFAYVVRSRRCIPRSYLIMFYAQWRNRWRITAKLGPRTRAYSLTRP